MTAVEDVAKQIEHLARALKAPRIRDAAGRLGDQARDAGWSHEEYLAAVLDREVSARDASGARLRIRAAGFGTAKTIEDFVFDHQPGLKRDTIAHLATGAFLAEAENVILLGPPGTGKTHLAVGLGIKAAQAGHRVLFATATEWITRLQAAHNAGRLTEELARLRRFGLLIVDEVGYIPFEQDAADLFFQLVSSRYEHASLILTSNLPFARWGDVFGDQVVAAAMIDRIVHHAEVITLKAAATACASAESTPCHPPEPRTRRTEPAHFSSVETAHFSSVVDTSVTHRDDFEAAVDAGRDVSDRPHAVPIRRSRVAPLASASAMGERRCAMHICRRVSASRLRQRCVDLWVDGSEVRKRYEESGGAQLALAVRAPTARLGQS